MLRRSALPLSLLSLAVALSGCTEAPTRPDPELVKSLRDRYVLAEEPADAQTTLDWRDAQPEEGEPAEAGEEASEDKTITLVGQIGGMPNPWGAAGNEEEFPWRAGKALFFLVDPSTVAEFAAHAEAEGVEHAADCPFCSREAADKTDAVAVVSFAEEPGDTVPAAIDARDLFGLEAGDVVVVRGEWSLVGDVLMVQANGIYRRP